jgi:polyhydroxyalkanoate synthesis regulator phasin
MHRRHKLAVVGAAFVGVVVVGAAIGATKVLTPKQEAQAVIDDAAGQLGVEPNELSKALKQAFKNRVDAAVEDGRLTKEQGAKMKERIDADGVPMLGLGPRGFHEKRELFRGGKGFPGKVFVGKLESAADYLGMEREKLFEALRSGKTLAEVARDRDKSVDGLIDAMVDATSKRLDEAVAAGKLTEADKTEVLGDLKERISRLVNEGRPRHHAERGSTHFIPSVF